MDTAAWAPPHDAEARPRRLPPAPFRLLLTGVVALLMAAGTLVALAVPADAATSGTIIGVASGRCLDVTGNSTALKTRIIIWDCNGQANQTWTLTAAGELRVFNGTRCLDVAGGRVTAGGVVKIYSCTGGANQKWTVNANGTITGVQSGLCLDVTGASTARGSYVQTWTCHGGGNQQWRTKTQTVTTPPQTVTVTASPSPSTTTTTTPAPVPAYGVLVQDYNFGTAKTTPGAIKDLSGLWNRWLDHVFWQAPVDPSQVVMQPDHMDLVMTSASGGFNNVYIESKFVFDPAKSYYIESRLKTPGVTNVVPAFWLYANTPDVKAGLNGAEGWQSEIDAMEQFTPTFGDNTKVFSTTHHAPNHQNLSQSIATTTDLSKNYHTIGLEYTPTRIRFYLDGQPSSAWFDYVWSTSSTPNAPPAIVLDIESASTLGTGGTPTTLPNALSVDYVRVWQLGS